MPRNTSVAPPRAAPQTSGSAARPGQKRLSSSRPVMFADSPKAAVEPSTAADSGKNDLYEVPDSPPPGSQSQGVYFQLLLCSVFSQFWSRRFE